MDNKLILKNNLKEIRSRAGLSQQALASIVGVSCNTISSIETGQFNPTAKLALISGGLVMNKKEILEKSRQENKGTDLFERDAMNSASHKAIAVGGLVCMFLSFMDIFLSGSFNYTLWGVYLSMTGTTLLVKYFHLKKIHELIFGIIELLLAIAFIVMHFLRYNAR